MNWCPFDLDRDVLEALIWRDARRRYRRGETVRSICDRYGFCKTTFYEHANAGGWLRPQPARPGEEPAPRLSPTELGSQAEALAYAALERVLAGDEKGADGALKAAGRLLRIKRHLGEAAEAIEPTAAEKEQARIAGMGKADLIAEILARAGVER